MRDWLNNWRDTWAKFLEDKEGSTDLGNRLGYESIQRIRKEKEKLKSKGTLIN